MAVFAVMKYAGRCGSHWLKSCLTSHPDVFMLRREQFDISFEAWQQKERWPELIGHVFDPLDAGGAHGCLVKAGYMGDPSWRPLREEIAKVPDMHIILNSRRDYLAQYLSLTIAEISNHYDSELDPVEIKPFEINIPRMLTIFGNWDKKIELYQELYGHLPFYHACYEAMDANIVDVVTEIYRFLGVDDTHKLSFRTKKQRRKSATEMIVNFEEVATAISNSPWADRLSLDSM